MTLFIVFFFFFAVATKWFLIYFLLDLKPIAKVDQVSQYSPSSDAGLIVDDLILSFGPVKGDGNFMKDIGELVRVSEGREIDIIIRRKEDNQYKVKKLVLV